MSLIVFIGAAALAGDLLLAGARVPGGAEGWLYRLLAGFCVCAVLMLGLGSYSLDLALGVLLALGLAGWLFLFLRRPAALPRAPLRAMGPRLGVFERVCLAAIAASMLAALVGALAPVTAWDATVAHIALPKDYARADHIYLNAGNVYSAYPHFMHTLYTVAYHGFGEQNVTLLNWLFAGLGCAAVYTLGKRALSRECGLIAAALFATAPIFADQAGTVSIDLPFTALSTAALAALLAWHHERRWAFLVLSAGLAGSACGVRHTGYLVCALLFVGVLFGPARPRIGAALAFAGMAAVCAGPWLLRSAVLAGNPFFPLLLDWFPTGPVPHIAVSAFAAHESIGQTGGTGILQFLRFPYDIIMRPHQYDGWAKSPGGMVLALGVPGLLAGGPRIRRLAAFSAAGGTVFFFFQRLARYLLPFFVPMMVAAAATAERLRPLRKGILVLLAASFIYGLGLHAAAVHFKIPVALRLQPRAAYLAARVERYPAFDYANTHCAGGKILTADQRSYYLDPPAYQNHWGMRRLAQLPPEAQRQWLADHRIRYILLPVDYLLRSGALKAVVPMFDAWARDETHFQLMKRLVLPNPRGEGVERVEFYRFLGVEGDTP